ncbi:hypothetical protein EVAR_38163_1 [Eumeta japonica]|uniref:Uncharacterized protein n=1 Tax=Eumeta variegata TaxID=151549 RepID=A0A4C1ZM37_EUMVA|nr:hypothetical protein EVAR_38163_1 [Eumeta japonica]
MRLSGYETDTVWFEDNALATGSALRHKFVGSVQRAEPPAFVLRRPSSDQTTTAPEQGTDRASSDPGRTEV